MSLSIYWCRFQVTELAAALADGHDHADEDCGGDDHAEQVLEDDTAGIGSGDDVGNKGVNDHEGHDADYDGYQTSY